MVRFGKAWRRAFGLSTGVGGLVVAVVACSSSSGGGMSFPPGSTEYTGPDGGTSALESPGTCSGVHGGAVVGPADQHCVLPDGGALVVTQTAAACNETSPPTSDAGAGDDGGGGGDSGDPCPGDMNAYGAVEYGTTGADDDCKYDVSWQSTPICENEPVYFTVMVTNRSDGSPMVGVTMGGTVVSANPRPDVVLGCTHPIPNTPRPRDPSPEIAPGTYVMGPIAFDEPGRWVVRFHFNETCFDAPNSPHGHAAFYVDVP